jgi:hypothetical protein
MISETIDQGVPNWPMALDEKRFAKRNPNVVNHQIAAPEIPDFKVGCLLNGLTVFVEAVEESRAFCRDFRVNVSFSTSCGNRLAHVDRDVQIVRAGIPIFEFRVGVK